MPLADAEFNATVAVAVPLFSVDDTSWIDRIGARSSSVIVTVAVLVDIDAFDAPDKVIVKVSLFSSSPSLIRGIVIDLVVSPARKEMLELNGLKSFPDVAVPELAPTDTEIFFSDAALNDITNSAESSPVVVTSAVDIVGGLSSSVIASSPIASLMVAFDGLDKVTMRVSSNSSKSSEITVIGMSFEVSPGLNVSVVVDTAV